MNISRRRPDYVPDGSIAAIRYEVRHPDAETPHGWAEVFAQGVATIGSDRILTGLVGFDPSLDGDSSIVKINSFFPNGRIRGMDPAMLRQGTATRVLEAITADAVALGARGIWVPLATTDAMHAFLVARGFGGYKLDEKSKPVFRYKPLTR